MRIGRILRAAPGRLVPFVAGACLAVASGVAARADRHCSFARESAYYAEETSADALKASAAACPAKMQEALGRLRETLEQLDICSCSYAQEPLHRWFDGRSPGGLVKGDSCSASAAAINAISKTVLEQVEKCF